MLKENLARAIQGEGSTTHVSGEPGIGKTRLIDEFLKESEDVKILKGGAMADRLHPFLIFSRALDGVVDKPLFQEDVEKTFTEILAIDQNGLLISKVSPGMEDEMDADIFAAMFSAVQNFVQDSLDKAGEGKSELGRLEYGDLRIIIEHGRFIFLTAVFKGGEHADMKKVLRETLRHIEEKYARLLDGWLGDVATVRPIESELQRAVERKFLVKRDTESVNIENERARIANRVLEELKLLAAEKPVLLLLEDIHWADQSSLYVLNYLARNIGAERINIVGTFRPGESDILEPALASMRELNLVTEIALSQLGRNSVAGIVDSVYRPNRFGPEFVETLADQCEGNPFFVLEMLRQMEEEKSIGKTAGSYVIVNQDYTIPDSLEGVVHRRLGVLEPDAMSLAEYGSCIGREFECSTLLSLHSIQDPAGAFDKIQNRRVMIRNNGTGEFIHAIYQDVIYGEIGQRWKSVYHRNLGEYYESVYGDDLDSVLYELARHFSRSNMHEKAFEYSYRAGKKAEGAYASEQAAEFFRTALALIDALPKTDENRTRKLELMERLADALKKLGELKEALDLYTKLEKEYEDNADPLLRILLKMAGASHSIGDFKKVPVILKRGIGAYQNASADISAEFLARLSDTLVQQEPSESKKYLAEATARLGEVTEITTLSKVLSLLGSVHAHLNEGQIALELFKKSSAAAKESGDLQLIAAANRSLASHMHFQGDFVACADLLKTVLEIQEKLGDIVAMYGTLNSIGIAYSDNNALEKSVEAHERALAIARKLGNEGFIATSQGNLGYTLTGLGQLDKALACHSESLTLRQKDEGEDGTAWSHSDIGLIYYQAGNMDASEASHRKSLEIWEKLDYKLGLALEHLYLGDIYAARGDKNTAIEHYETSIELGRKYVHKSPLFYSLKGMFEIHAAEPGQFDEFEGLARQIGRPDMMMKVLRLRAEYAIECGDSEAAAGFIEEAVVVEKSSEQGVTIEMESARVMLAKAKLLSAQGDKASAKELAVDVVQRFKRRGRRFEAERAEQWVRGL